MTLRHLLSLGCISSRDFYSEVARRAGVTLSGNHPLVVYVESPSFSIEMFAQLADQWVEVHGTAIRDALREVGDEWSLPGFRAAMYEAADATATGNRSRRGVPR